MRNVVVLVDPCVGSGLLPLQQYFHITRSGLVLRITALYSEVWPVYIVRSSLGAALQAGGSSGTGDLGN